MEYEWEGQGSLEAEGSAVWQLKEWSKNNEESIDSGKEEEEIGAKDSLG